MWETISLFFDFILLFGGFLAMRYAKMIGGSIGHNSMNFMTAGFFVLGIAHLSETLLDQFVTVSDPQMMEVLHRLIVFLAFVLLITGYRRLAKFVNS